LSSEVWLNRGVHSYMAMAGGAKVRIVKQM
jgi:hypothetical protein